MKNNKLQRLLTLARQNKFKPYKKPGVVLWKKIYHPGLGFIKTLDITPSPEHKAVMDGWLEANMKPSMLSQFVRDNIEKRKEAKNELLATGGFRKDEIQVIGSTVEPQPFLPGDLTNFMSTGFFPHRLSIFSGVVKTQMFQNERVRGYLKTREVQVAIDKMIFESDTDELTAATHICENLTESDIVNLKLYAYFLHYVTQTCIVEEITGSFDTFDKGLKTIELISRALTEINNRKQPTKTTEGENNEAQ